MSKSRNHSENRNGFAFVSTEESVRENAALACARAACGRKRARASEASSDMRTREFFNDSDHCATVARREDPGPAFGEVVLGDVAPSVPHVCSPHGGDNIGIIKDSVAKEPFHELASLPGYAARLGVSGDRSGFARARSWRPTVGRQRRSLGIPLVARHGGAAVERPTLRARGSSPRPRGDASS